LFTLTLSFRASIWWLWINWNIEMKKTTLKWKKKTSLQTRKWKHFDKMCDFDRWTDRYSSMKGNTQQLLTLPGHHSALPFVVQCLFSSCACCFYFYLNDLNKLHYRNIPSLDCISSIFCQRFVLYHFLFKNVHILTQKMLLYPIMFHSKYNI